MSADKEVFALRSEVADLRSESAELRKLIEALSANQKHQPETQNGSEAVMNRRKMLKNSLIATGALVGTALSTTQSAHAQTGFNMIQGENNLTQTPTGITYTGAGIGFNHFLSVGDSFVSGGALYPSAIAGLASSKTTNGVYAFSGTRNDTDDKTGHAIVAFANPSARSNILLESTRANGPLTDTISHRKGELVNTTNDGLWLCIAGGTPGTWKKVSGPDTAGSFHLLSVPSRVYDSRASEGGRGPLSAGSSETVDMTTTNVVPQGITGVLVNLTIVSPTGSGYAVMWAGGNRPLASNINYTAGDVVANNVTTAVDVNRMATIFSFAQTEYVVDVIGYYL